MGRRLMFSREALLQEAGERVYARGVDYFNRGMVEILRLRDDRVDARVQGGKPYLVRLEVEHGDIDGECDCAAFRDFGFCKHMVATALAANNTTTSGRTAPDARADIPAYLETLDRAALIKLILRLAEDDPLIERQLTMRASVSSGDAVVIAKTLRAEVDAATRISGFIDYGQVGGWVSRVEPVIASIESAIDSGAGAVALPVIERLVERLNEASGSIDDSNGLLGELLNDALRLHLAACRIAKPDPMELARNLFDRELANELGFDCCIETYADVLGDVGRAEMGRLARKAWDEIPPASPKRARTDDDGFKRRQLAAILDYLATEAGDLDERIAIRSRHLGGSYDYVLLVQFCIEHKRRAEAVKWVEEGLFVFEDRTDERLVLLAVDLLGREKGQALLWRSFAADPSETLFRRLTAGLNGNGRRAAVDRALAALKASAAKSPPTPYGLRGDDASDLALSILIAEARFAEAWDLAKIAGASEGRIDQLALASEAAHPQESAGVYRQRIESDLARVSGRYERAKTLIDRLAAIAKRTGAVAAHEAYVAQLQTRHRAKRNFMKLMSPG